MDEVLNDPTSHWAEDTDASIRRLLNESAVTYFSDGTRRPWQLDGLPFMSLRKLRGHETPSFNYTLLAIATLIFVVFMERSLRKIHIQYPRRQVGMKVYDGGSSHLQ